MVEKCQVCHRQVTLNANGKMRRHWCPEAGDSKALSFATGGTLRVRIDANWMLFRDAERALLTAIIDAIDVYEQQHKDVVQLVPVVNNEEESVQWKP